MINAIHGKIIQIDQNSIIVLAQSGIEYFLEVSSNTSSYYASMSLEEKNDVRILAVLQHREDSMTLFGFATDMERLCFNELQTVSGIGAKGALKILSGITVEKLIIALDQQDVKTLSKVPGLGAKTAQKLILQLRNVLVLEVDEESNRSNGAASSKARFADLISSFTEMGYERKVVVKAIDDIIKENELLLSNLDDRAIEEKIFPMVFRRIG